MILADGKHIQGIFVFDRSAQYESGDFVVDDDCLYICTSGEPIQSDVRPRENLTYFSPYPGKKISSVEEYNEYIANPDGKEDKYISSSVLNAVLQQGYFGFGDTGLITAYISQKKQGIDGEEKYIVDTNVYGIKDRLVDNTMLLDLVMRQPDLNNAYIRVDRNLPELEHILPEPESPTEEAGGCCILRQYTYVDINNMGKTDNLGTYINYRYRVQELMDYSTGTVYYRYTIGTLATGLTNWQYTGTIESWKSLVVSTSLLKKMNAIINYYNENMQRNNTPSTSNNSTTSSRPFNFVELIPSNADSLSTRSLVKSDSDIPGGLVIPAIDGETKTFSNTDVFLTINIKVPTVVGGKLFKSYSTTINTRDVASIVDAKLEYYYLDDDILLRVKANVADSGETYIELSVTDSSRQSGYSGAIINSIYYRNE